MCVRSLAAHAACCVCVCLCVPVWLWLCDCLCACARWLESGSRVSGLRLQGGRAGGEGGGGLSAQRAVLWHAPPPKPGKSPNPPNPVLSSPPNPVLCSPPNPGALLPHLSVSPPPLPCQFKFISYLHLQLPCQLPSLISVPLFFCLYPAIFASRPCCPPPLLCTMYTVFMPPRPLPTLWLYKVCAPPPRWCTTR